MPKDSLGDEFKREPAVIYQRAIQSLFHRLSSICDGAVAVDREGRIAWINEKYISLLGLATVEQARGLRIEDVIPNSLLRQVMETGEPILLDIMEFGDQSFVVTRMPLLDDTGEVLGAIGFVLYDRLHYLKPLVSKFAALQTELTKAQRALADARGPRYTLANFVGSSPPMVEVKRQIRRAAEQDSAVLLLGETGTGKELVAQAIHGISSRARRAMIAVNVAAIPDSLLEAEMFGVAPGAFTGADKKPRIGKLQAADGGTLFLDEIGDMPLPLQAKLLRALQEQQFEMVGSNNVISVDVRIIAATNANLQTLVDKRLFRSDLYYRLNVLTMQLPPLRDIKADIEAIAHTILEQIAARSGVPLRSLAPSGLSALCDYAWPGNVRELRNVLERACVMSDIVRLTASDFSSIVPGQADIAGEHQSKSVGSLTDAVDDLERDMLQRALNDASGKAERAARILGISRANLYKKMHRFGIRLRGETPNLHPETEKK